MRKIQYRSSFEANANFQSEFLKHEKIENY